MIIISPITSYFHTPPRLLVVTGHFGAGKTNVALNLAHMLKAAGREVTLIDLDIVNPYFRAADAEDALRDAEIEYINPPFANTNVDIPVLGADIQRVFPMLEHNPNASVIFDVGGDNGSVALGRYHTELTRLGAYVLCVENAYRPLTDSAEAMLENLREIEAYSRLRCDAIVNNSNLGEATTIADLLEAAPMMETFSDLAGLPVLFTTVCSPLRETDLPKGMIKSPVLEIQNYTRKLF